MYTDMIELFLNSVFNTNVLVETSSMHVVYSK